MRGDRRIQAGLVKQGATMQMKIVPEHLRLCPECELVLYIIAGT